MAGAWAVVGEGCAFAGARAKQKGAVLVVHHKAPPLPVSEHAKRGLIHSILCMASCPPCSCSSTAQPLNAGQGRWQQTVSRPHLAARVVCTSVIAGLRSVHLRGARFRPNKSDFSRC